MALYTVLTRLLGREPKGEYLPGAIIDLPEDQAAELIALGALEPAAEGAVATDDADEILSALNTMTVKPLRFLANGMAVDLGEASKKADIVRVLANSVDRNNPDLVAAFIQRIAEVPGRYAASQ